MLLGDEMFPWTFQPSVTSSVDGNTITTVASNASHTTTTVRCPTHSLSLIVPLSHLVSPH
jgi:hypothetical protein